MRVLGPRTALACYLMLLVAYLGGAMVPLMDDGAAKHAAIALRIFESGNWTHLIDAGRPVLDKPHLLYWLSALSFWVFDVDAVSYRLPSLLFSFLAVYSTVRLGAMLHNETKGRLAGVILASAFVFLLANNDVRTDAMLAGSVVFTVWQLLVFVTETNERARPPHLIMGGLGLVLGFAAKGALGFVAPLFIVFVYLVYRLDWKRLFDPLWLLLPPVLIVFASPLLYAFYDQFGLEGVKFILWTQTAERLSAGTAGGSDPLFYYHTFLWVFLPWSLLMLWSLAHSAKRLTNDRYWPRAKGDAVTAGTIVTAFIALSKTNLHLLHYLVVLLPFFAIQLAGWLPARLRRASTRKWLWRVQAVVFAVFAVAAFLVNGWAFPMYDWRIAFGALIMLVLGFWALPFRFGGARLVTASAGVSAAFWLLLNFNFYPNLLESQAGTTLGRAARIAIDSRKLTPRISPADFYYVEGGGRAPSFDFAMKRVVPTLSLDAVEELVRAGKAPVVYCKGFRDRAVGLDSPNSDCRQALGERGLRVEVLDRGQEDYRITRLSWRFLDPNTRKDTITGVADLLRIKPAPLEQIQ